MTRSAGPIRTLLTGLAFVESPRWHDGRLWFCDWGTQEVIAVDLAGSSEVIVRIPGPRDDGGRAQFGPLCIDWLPDGRLLIVSGRDRAVLRREHDGTLVTHARLDALSPHAWNDIVADVSGNAYVNTIGFDFPGGEYKPGLLALVRPDGSAHRIAGELSFPNGMAVTPDGATLLVAESYANRITAFDITADGGVSNRRVWADAGDDHPDGICLDDAGAVWYADVANQRCVRIREGGEVTTIVDLDRGCFACALGGAEREVLFLLAAQWGGPNDATSGARTGQVLAALLER